MSILFVGSRASDFGGVAIPETNATYFDSAYSSEAAEVSAIFNVGLTGFQIPHNEAVSGTVWYHFSVYTGTYLTSANNDGYWLALLDVSGSELGRINITDGVYRAQVFGDTTEESLASIAISEATFQTFDIKFTAGANLEMTVYQNGVLQATVTAANTGAKPAPRRISFDHSDMVYSTTANNLKFYYSEVVITDNESTVGWRIATLTPAANGNYNNWNGGYADIVSSKDGLFINSQNTNERQSWTLSAYGGPATTTAVRAVVNTFFGVAGAGGTGPQNIAPFVRHASTDVDGSNMVLGERILVEYTTNPQTSLAWDTADLATLEVGVLSKV
ncbi:hypothetical protein vBDshPR2C_36 [Dinoroseobacter phage vBDshPR2C]|uniref:Uncharacterized protein n=1 Tax=Dinoroseobacter phage vBDshPR2C TaxID=1498169 RepID=A0A0A7CHP2_9CAUD|nr:hypothetical protein vBDshPR2C_36 [Dinoroseobacter phage vBDshPR2C]